MIWHQKYSKILCRNRNFFSNFGAAIVDDIYGVLKWFWIMVVLISREIISFRKNILFHSKNWSKLTQAWLKMAHMDPENDSDHVTRRICKNWVQNRTFWVKNYYSKMSFSNLNHQKWKTSKTLSQKPQNMNLIFCQIIIFRRFPQVQRLNFSLPDTLWLIS